MVNAISEYLVFLDVHADSKDDALKMIARFAFEKGRVNDESLYCQSLFDRENESSTGFTDGIAIPHGKSKAVIEASIILVRFKNGVDWESMDGEPTTLAIALAIPEEGAEIHMKMLSSIARSLMKEDFRKGLMTSNSEEEIINSLKSAIV